MKLKNKSNLLIILAITLFVFSSCTRSGIEQPDPTGPSTLATMIKLYLAPNVIAAGMEERQTTTVTAHLFNFDGTPIANTFIYFDLRDAFGMKSYYGYIEGSQSVVQKTTDSSGRVTVTYYGPLISEMENVDQAIVYINAYVGWQNKELVAELCPIYILSEMTFNEIEFELQAYPNVLWCTSTRPTSKIRGIFTFSNGLPIVGRKVFFKILSGPGEFDDGKTKTFVLTDENGIAEITYIGPLNTEIAFDTFVRIQGQPETDWIHIHDPYDPLDDPDAFYMHKEMDLRLIKGTD